MSTTAMILRSDLNRWVLPLARARLTAARIVGMAATDTVLRLSRRTIFKWGIGQVMLESDRKFWADVWPTIEKALAHALQRK